MGLGFAVGPTPTGLLAGRFGLPSPYWGMTGLLLLTTACVATLSVPEQLGEGAVEAPAEQPPVFTQLRNGFVLRIQALLYMTNFTCGFSFSAMGPYLAATFGYGPAMQGLMMLPAPLAYLLSRPLSLLLSTLAAPWIVTTTGVACLAGGVSLAGLVPHAVPLIAGNCLMWAAVGLVTTPCLPLLADIAQMRLVPHGNGQLYAMADAMTNLGCTLGPLVAAVPLPFWLTSQLLGAVNLLLLFASVYLKDLTPVVGLRSQSSDIGLTTPSAPGPPSTPNVEDNPTPSSHSSTPNSSLTTMMEVDH